MYTFNPLLKPTDYQSLRIIRRATDWYASSVGCTSQEAPFYFAPQRSTGYLFICQGLWQFLQLLTFGELGLTLYTSRENERSYCSNLKSIQLKKLIPRLKLMFCIACFCRCPLCRVPVTHATYDDEAQPRPVEPSNKKLHVEEAFQPYDDLVRSLAYEHQFHEDSDSWDPDSLASQKSNKFNTFTLHYRPHLQTE
jgi:hypothetical protein